MFIVGEIVKPSGHGRTATWEGMCGTVTRVGERSVFIQWHDCAVEEELGFDEVVTTGTFNRTIPHHARVLDGSEEGKLVTFYDDAKKSEVRCQAAPARTSPFYSRRIAEARLSSRVPLRRRNRATG